MELVKISRIIFGIIPSYDCTDIILCYYKSNIEVINPIINKDGYFEFEINDFSKINLEYIKIDKLVFNEFGYIKFKKYKNKKRNLNNDEKTFLTKIGFKVDTSDIISINRNIYGNFEYKGLVFDLETEHVYGRQSENKILDLTEKDIEICKKSGFRYRLLNHQK